MAYVGEGSAGQVLQAVGTTGSAKYSTATYPVTAGTSGKILISDGTNIVSSTPTYPNAASTALKLIKSDGTNFVTTTVTYPDASVTAGKVIISDGTNYIASTPTFPNASATTRKIIVSDGTNWTASTETYAVPGTSGNLLTSDGTNWTSEALSQGLTLLQAQNASNSATIDFTTGGINTTFKKLLLSFKNVQGATDAVTLRMQMSNDGGSTWTVTGYTAGINQMQYNSATVTNTNSTTNFILTGTIDNTATTRLGVGEINIYLTSSNDMYISGTCTFVNDTGAIPAMGIVGGRGGATGANAFRLLMSSGNISTGRFYLYGYKDS